jgi:hypothetical protein
VNRPHKSTAAKPCKKPMDGRVTTELVITVLLACVASRRKVSQGQDASYSLYRV